MGDSEHISWVHKKIEIDNNIYNIPHVSEGDIWWCSIGKNIGIEINGKSNLFSRPVIVFRKLNKQSFIGFPLTTKLKSGTWYFSFMHKGKQVTANLHQVRVFDVKRLYSRNGVIDSKVLENLLVAFIELIKK